MRILATCQYGWPEPYPSLYPMDEMVKRGHYVYAVTGTPNYPMGDIYPEYKNKKNITEYHNGVCISHVPVIPRKHDSIHRFLNYHSYPITAKRKLLSLKEEFDVVFANQSSPVMMVSPAIEYAKRKHKKVVMYCMDLWPASLCVGGVKKNSLLYKFYWNLSNKVYKNVDVILVTSRMFKDYFVSEFGIPEERIKYLPQYALSNFNDITQYESKQTTDFVFAGNVGAAQNLEVVLRSALIIQNENIDDHGKRIMFHIIGNGQALDSLQKYSKDNNINNVVFHGRKPSEEMPKYYSMADAMIVTMLPDPFVSLTLPAKVQSYMASGKPILASANGEIEKVITEASCGFCATADNERAFVNAIQDFIDSDKRIEMGNNGKNYYQNNFAVEIVMDKLENILLENIV